LQGGPDFRRYGGNAPVNNDSQTTYYGEAVVTATFSPQDTLSVNYKQWQWVSSIGEVPYFDSNYDLNYKHRFNDKLTGSLGARLQESDYTSANALSGPADAPDSITKLRKDLLYTFSAGVQYAVTPHLSTQLGYALDLGRNAQSGISDAARVFNHQLVSLGVLFAF
jgi:opacity protein-like surface antigen